MEQKNKGGLRGPGPNGKFLRYDEIRNIVREKKIEWMRDGEKAYMDCDPRQQNFYDGAVFAMEELLLDLKERYEE